MGLVFTNNALYPLYVTSEGGDAASIGLFIAALNLAAIAGRPLIGPMIDRLGVQRVLQIGTLLFIIPPLAYHFLLGSGLTPVVWFFRLIQGFGLGAHFSAFFTMAAQMAPEGRRHESIAMYGISGLGANLVGPVMGEYIVMTYGLSPFFLLMTCLGLAALILISFTKIPRAVDSEVSFKLSKFITVIKHRPIYLALVLAAMLSFTFSTPFGFLAPLAGMRSITGFGLYFSGYAVAGIVIRLIGPKWGDKFGWRRILIPAFTLYGIGLFVIFFSNSVAGLILAGTVCGCAHGLAFPAVTSLGYTLAPAGAKGTSIALVTGAMDTGSAISGFVLGQVAQAYHYGIIFPLSAIIPFSAAILLLWTIIRNPSHLSQQTN